MCIAHCYVMFAELLDDILIDETPLRHDLKVFEYRGEKIIPFLTFTQNLDFVQQDIENLVFEKFKYL